MILYYSDGYHEDLIELSDEHILWHVKFASDAEYDFDYMLLCQQLALEFKEIYGTDLIYAGRSGRHVCVEDTPDNRRQLMNMQRTIWRMQNEVLKRFDDGWRINKYGTLYHVNGSVCIGSVSSVSATLMSPRL